MKSEDDIIKDLQDYKDRDYIKEGITIFDNDPRYRKMIIGNALKLIAEQCAKIKELEDKLKIINVNTMVTDTLSAKDIESGVNIDNATKNVRCKDYENCDSDIERVIKGIQCHKYGMCAVDNNETCPYWGCDDRCSSELLSDALSLLEQQQETIKQYQKADSFLYAHGWKWEEV